MEQVRWKQIPLQGFELYEISNFGNLRKRNKLFNTYPSNNHVPEHRYIDSRLNHKGYLHTALKGKHFLVHRLVCITFKPQLDLTLHVNHIDGNKLNNYHFNLEWCTNAENMQHAIATGLHNIAGENNYNCKYTDKQVLEARKLKEEGKTNKEIGLTLSIAYGSVHKLIHGNRPVQRIVVPKQPIKQLVGANRYE